MTKAMTVSSEEMTVEEKILEVVKKAHNDPYAAGLRVLHKDLGKGTVIFHSLGSPKADVLFDETGAVDISPLNWVDVKDIQTINNEEPRTLVGLLGRRPRALKPK